MTGMASALMVKSLLLRNWLIDVNWVVFMGDESWKKNLNIAQNTLPISTFIPQAAWGPHV